MAGSWIMLARSAVSVSHIFCLALFRPLFDAFLTIISVLQYPVKDCNPSDGPPCAHHHDLSATIFPTVEECCRTTLGWVDQGLCVARGQPPGPAPAATNCLKAQMAPSNSQWFPGIEGDVMVCFDGELSPTSGTLVMNGVNGLQPSIADGSVHIHSGTSCGDQGGHYFSAGVSGILGDGDPWFNTPDANIAPDGASYATDAAGRGFTRFQFDQGYGYSQTIGKVVVMHDSKTSGVVEVNGEVKNYQRVACGVLQAA